MKKNLLLIMFFSLALFSAKGQSESDIVISEFLYNQPGQDTLEFIELYNKGNAPVNLDGYKFTSGIFFTFPDYTLDPGKYVVVASYPEFSDPFFGITALKWDSGGLNNAGEKIVLKDAQGAIADSIEYGDSFPWPEEADGEGSSGYSLELCDVNADNSIYENWDTSNSFVGAYNVGGANELIFSSPGMDNDFCEAPGDVVLPEVKSITTIDFPIVRIVFSEPVTNANIKSNYSGLSISDAIVSNSKDTVTLFLSEDLEFAKRYSVSVNNIKDNSGNTIESKTFFVGFNDTKPLLVINEILYDNPGTDTLEYIELYYAGSEPAELGGIKFSDGIDFMFPSTTVEPGDYLVLAKNDLVMEEFYGLDTIIKWTDGSLDNNGEKLLIVNSRLDTIDFVDYNDKAPWPVEGAGYGHAIVLCGIELDNAQPSSWNPSYELAGDFLGSSIYGNPGEFQECTVGKRDMKNFSLFTISPNPSNGNFTLTGNEPEEKVVEVYDLNGNNIFTSSFKSKLEVVIPKKSKGILMLRVISTKSGAIHQEKIIVR